MKAHFLKLTDLPDKEANLLRLAAAVSAGTVSPERLFSVEPADFTAIPSSPMAYWTSANVRALYRAAAIFATAPREALNGASTCDDFRYVRAWFEPLPPTVQTPRNWVPYAKGGKSALCYADVTAVVAWDRGRRTFRGFIGRPGRWNPAPVSSEHYFQAGLTWPLRGIRFSAQALGAGAAFSVGGKVAIAPPSELLGFLGLFNSRAFDALIRLYAGKVGGVQYEVGIIGEAPLPIAFTGDTGPIALAAHRAWSLKRSLDTLTETSHAFLLPALLQVDGATLGDRAAAWAARVAATEGALAAIQREIDDIAFRLYGIAGEDRARIEAESGAAPAAAPTDEEAPDDDNEAADEPDDDEDDTSAADAATLATELLSWAVGVAFGRFDLDLATGSRAPPPEPGPFDPLPARSPGMIPDDSRALEVLVDDPGHPEDIVARVTAVFAAVFGEHHEARLDEAVHFAGAADLRTWLRRSFFPFHLKRYSKSRRKAPIWWPLSTASGSYTLWVAWPRLTRDTLYRLTSEQEPYVAAKVAQETRKLTSLKQDAGKNPTSAQAKAIGAQEDFVAELTALRDELAMVAPMWNPVHDDGVVLHAALLWRVVRDAGWQKECREKWEGLVAGKYDWAHIAMHLWPERVVPKCREDRSLAIAHGLEERFWVEIAGKWRLRDATDQAMNEEIASRSSAAVKKGLRAMVEAPAPARGRRGRR